MGPAISPYDFGCIYCSLFTLFIFIFATFRLDMIAALSVASSDVLLVMVPALFGAFFWKRGAAAGTFSGVVIGGLVATYFTVKRLEASRILARCLERSGSFSVVCYSQLVNESSRRESGRLFKLALYRIKEEKGYLNG